MPHGVWLNVFKVIELFFLSLEIGILKNTFLELFVVIRFFNKADSPL